jgi:hypothetical protein
LGDFLKTTVYIETTIPSYLTANPSRDIFQLARQSITRKWWEAKRQDYDLVTSDFTITECRKGDPAAAQRRIDCLREIPLLEITEDMISLSNSYMEFLSIPKDSKDDTLHLAACVIRQIDYLLTWNCRHLGPVTMQRVQKYNDNKGLFVPILVTPEAFFDEREFNHDLS